MDGQYAFTVFTAAFNRAHTLHRVHESLLAQTFGDLEWLIVDDGSTDRTADVVEQWRKDAPFPIRYLYQSNQGKHVAFNRGVREARGRLFLSLDSDDACVPRALERFMWHWEHIPEGTRERFTGVTALCVDQFGRAVGSRFPADVTDSDSREIRYRHGVVGEKWGFHRTAVLRRYPFPEITDAKFVPEGVVWRAIARSYKTRYVNEPLRVYWVSDEQGARLSATSPSKPTLTAMAMWQASILNDDLQWLPHAPASFLRSAVNYSRFSFGAGIGVGQQQRQIRPAARLLWLLSLPLGLAASLTDRVRLAQR